MAQIANFRCQNGGLGAGGQSVQIADNRFQISECRRGLGVHQGQMTENRKQKSGMPVQISKWWRLHISDVKAAHQDLLQITEFRLQMSGGSKNTCFSCFTFQMADCRSHRQCNVGLSAQAERHEKQGRLLPCCKTLVTLRGEHYRRRWSWPKSLKIGHNAQCILVYTPTSAQDKIV